MTIVEIILLLWEQPLLTRASILFGSAGYWRLQLPHPVS